MVAEPAKKRSRLAKLLFGAATGKKTAPTFRASPESSATGSKTASKSASLPQKRPATTSEVLARVSKDFETFLETPSLKSDRRHVFDQFVKRGGGHGLHKIDNKDQPVEFTASRETWALIHHAAQYSNNVYRDPPPGNGVLIKPEAFGGRYRAFISLQELHNERDDTNQSGPSRVLAVAIRGSVTWLDWLAYGNGAPSASDIGGLPGSDADPRWHKGFLSVVKTMQDRVAEAVDQQLNSSTDSSKPIDLLFTGHSAGGAIAQIFYAMCTSTHSGSSVFAKALTKFRHVNCIVFGAPPVATSRIILSGCDPERFLNIVNEGDPVPLIQQRYVDVLLKSFVLLPGSDEMRRLYPTGIAVPELEFRVSGHCIVLRDSYDPYTDEDGWNAMSVHPEVLERKLFGNVAAHHMMGYLWGITALASTGEAQSLGN